MATPAFKPYGKPPPFDLEEYKDSFDLWHKKWTIFLSLSTIDSALDAGERAVYKAHTLLSCLSTDTLQAVLSMGLTDTHLDNHTVVIDHLRARCNASRNRHVWRQQFSAKKQGAQQSADDWLCELRDLARKCEFQTDCCARCEPTRILGQLIFGLESDEVRVKLLEQGVALTLDAALTILRTAEASNKQSINLKTGDAAAIQGANSTYRRFKQTSGSPPPRDKTGKPPARDNKPANDKFTGCGNCGSKSQCKPLTACPAQGRKCNKCGRPNHYAQVCRNSKPTPKQQSIYVEPSPLTVGAVKTSDLVAVSITPKKLPTANGEHAAVVVHALPDTGADNDAIPESLYMQKFSSVSLRKGIQPVTAVGSPIVNVSVFSTLIEWTTNDKNSCSLSTNVHVLRELKQPVLSKKSQQALGMLPSGYPHIRVGSVAHTPPSASQRQADLRQLMSEQPKIFDGACRPMTEPPCHFQLVKNAKPVAMRGSRPVSVPMLPKLKAELDALEFAGIVRRVSKLTEWVHPSLVVMKKNGDIRLVIDFRELNECIIRPNFETATPFQAVRTIPPGMRFFTVIDALKGYHQVLLDDPSIDLTTFSTPCGRYQYLRLPFGVTHAGDDYCRRVSEIFYDLSNCRRIVEDVLIFSATYDEHVKAVRTVFARAAAHNVSINTAKIVFAQPAVTFGGYVVEENGFRPDPALRRAISEFPVPKSITDVRSFFGLCQQVGHFSDQLAAALDPLSPLLKAGYAWEWTTRHDETFCAARKLLSAVHDLAFYDPKRPTSLHVDASRLNGLGFLLKQLDDSKKWRIVQAGSRFISSAESRYAMIELECLSAAWAMHNCRQFLEGLPSFELVTDHKPLIPILNSYAMDKLDNPRLLRLRLKMQRYSFVARWVPGKQNADADALSRAPVNHVTTSDELGEGLPSFPAKIAMMSLIGAELSTADPTLDPVLEKIGAAAIDPIMLKLRNQIVAGFPNYKCNLDIDLRRYWCVKDRLTIDESDDMIVLGPRVVIQQSLRAAILRDLSAMHQGATKMRHKHIPSLPPEPFRPRRPATRPFEQIHADLGEVNGRHFLVIVDSFSGWPHVVAFRDIKTSARAIIGHIRTFFSSVGAPVAFWSDNGPQFGAAEFRRFLADWGIIPLTSSPYYAKSNGRAEAAINTMKTLIRGSWTSGAFDEAKFAKSILRFRNAPRSGGASPSQLVFNRPVRDCLPAHRRSFAPEWQKATDTLEKRARQSKELQIPHYNKRTRPLAAFVVGNHVLIQHPVSKQWATPGIIVEVGRHREYLIKTPAGRIFRRNRRFLCPRIQIFPGTGSAPTATPIQPEPAPAPPPEPVQPPAEQQQQQQDVQPPADQLPPTNDPALPALRRSTRPRQLRRHFFPTDWTQ
ncbi:uncharacterized protein LOC123469907 [Daphnia magna]|uniref:uncharacterized protein LOC123469907 n=1 Tax=Daphnia magna TaxID=35525 RepID=UPI001E1BD00A|nr:uncharacterized protein LOC123469907 [Daphnia magna]